MKSTNIWIALVVIFLISIGVLTFLTCWDKETKSQILQFGGIIITGLGFFIAIVQLKIASNKYFSDLEKKSKDYLDLSVVAENVESFYNIKTKVINKSGENKDIDFSFLLITQQSEDIIEQANQIANFKELNRVFDCSNDFNEFKSFIEEPIFINKRIGLVPLDFYFSENIAIGNENPAYTYSFDNTKIKLDKGIYSVRFFIYPKVGYHRSTVDSLIIK